MRSVTRRGVGLALSAGAVLALAAGPTPAAPVPGGYSVGLVLQDASRLRLGTQVLVCARRAGRVTGLEARADSTTLVSVRITKRAFIPLRVGTDGSVPPVGAPKDVDLVLVPGDPTGPALPSGGTLPATDLRHILAPVSRSLAAGLTTGTPVRAGDAAVGRIGCVDKLSRRETRLTLEVPASRAVRANTRVRVHRRPGPRGAAYVELLGGSPDAPLLADWATVPRANVYAGAATR